MKLIRWLAGIALFFIIAFLSAYIVNFSASSISNDPAQWNNFGGYFGGTVGPFLSFLGLVAVLYTIHLQASTLKHMQDAFLEQQAYILRKEKKEEWMTIMRHAEEQIRKHLSIPTKKNGIIIGDVSNLINSLYTRMEKSQRLRDTSYAEQLIKEMTDDFTVRHLNPLCGLLSDFADYLTRYKALLPEEESDQIIIHYLCSYIGWYTRLDWIGIMPKNGMATFCRLLDENNKTQGSACTSDNK